MISEAVIEQLQERCESFEEENSRILQQFHQCQDEKNETINVMQKKLDDLEQNNKMSNLRIAGLEEEEDEDVHRKVMDLATQLKTKLEPKDIADARRMGPGKIGKTRDILIKFAIRSKRDILYKNRKMLHQSTRPVFVNEDLTQRRSHLFYEARRLKKQGRIFGAWSQEGNILIKVKERSQPKPVADYNDITILIKGYSIKKRGGGEDPPFSIRPPHPLNFFFHRPPHPPIHKIDQTPPPPDFIVRLDPPNSDNFDKKYYKIA